MLSFFCFSPQGVTELNNGYNPDNEDYDTHYIHVKSCFMYWLCIVCASV